MERLVFIGMLVFLAFVFIGILIWLRFRMKNTFENGVPVYDAPANNQTRTSKLSVGEYAVHIVLILISAVIAFRVMSVFRHGAAPIGAAIITPSIMSLFNARRRTGKSWMGIVAVLMVFVFLMFVYILIGLPDNAPPLKIDGTEINLTETKVSDLMDKGFEIYVSNGRHDYPNYNELLTTGSYTKYQGTGVSVPNGFKSYDSAVTRSTYLLVKKYGISYNIDGIDLLKKLDENEFTKVFGKKIWLTPSEPRDEYLGHYGVQWGAGNNEFFWNHYFMNLELDSNNDIVNFNFSSNIAAER